MMRAVCLLVASECLRPPFHVEGRSATDGEQTALGAGWAITGHAPPGTPGTLHLDGRRLREVCARRRRRAMPGTFRCACVAALVLAGTTANAAVLCARRHGSGFSGATVRVREVCRASEVQLTPDAVGFCCTPTTTTTSTSVTTTSVICPTTTTLGNPGCGPGQCFLPCFDGRTCTDPGDGQCTCTGPIQCGGQFSMCGGECPSGLICTQKPVPMGCPSIGCTCQ